MSYEKVRKGLLLVEQACQIFLSDLKDRARCHRRSGRDANSLTCHAVFTKELSVVALDTSSECGVDSAVNLSLYMYVFVDYSASLIPPLYGV